MEDSNESTSVFKENYILIPLLSSQGDVFALLELSNETVSGKSQQPEGEKGVNAQEQPESKSFNLEEQYLSQLLRFNLQNII